MGDGWTLGTEYGNVASVVGLVLTVGGFVVTWLNQRKLRKATEVAQERATQLVRNFTERLALTELSAASAVAQELRHMLRDRKWERAADRAERLRNKLGSMVASRKIEDEDQAFLGEAVDDAQLILRYAERLTGQSDGQLPTQALKKLDTLIMRLNAIDGRLKNAQLEVNNDA